VCFEADRESDPVSNDGLKTNGVIAAAAALVLVFSTLLLAGPAGAKTGRPGPHAGHQVTTLNGEVPPGEVTQADVTLLLRQSLGHGRILYQYRTTRPPGTRAPIHEHPNSGSTCVIVGESTLRVEGDPTPHTYTAGQCLFMPSGVAMANLNSGTIPFVTIDTFVIPRGAKPMEVLEPGHEEIEGEFKL